jgi:hypothetical protein
MKTIISFGKPHQVAKVCILLIMVALVTGMVGCASEGGGGGGGDDGEYELTMTVTPAGSGTATDLANTSPYAAGTVVSIKAVATSGYQFVNWSAPAGTLANPSAAETVFTMPAQDVDVTANFVVANNLLTVAVNPVGGGTATDETDGSPYAEGTIVSIKAEANLGYRFVSWTAPAGTLGNAIAAETTFTMPAQDVTVTANFEPTPQLLIYEDDFSNRGSGWGEMSVAHGEFSYEDGEYHILVEDTGYINAAWNSGAGPFTDFAVEIDARLVSGPDESGYGLTFRVQNNVDFYSFMVTGNGYYHLAKHNGEWVTLQAWTGSDFISEGSSTNHLMVVCRGTQIEVYVNGYHLATITDDSFPDGSVGMVAYASGPDTLVAFDNIEVYSLD